MVFSAEWDIILKKQAGLPDGICWNVRSISFFGTGRPISSKGLQVLDSGADRVATHNSG